MGRTQEKPRYNVISMRISDEEKETLVQLQKVTRKNVSDLMREAMELLKVSDFMNGTLNGNGKGHAHIGCRR
jgi:hypothetical protein